MFSILAGIFQVTKLIFPIANPQTCGYFDTGEPAGAAILFEQWASSLTGGHTSERVF